MVVQKIGVASGTRNEKGADLAARPFRSRDFETDQ
jgi:hypothetical protein